MTTLTKFIVGLIVSIMLMSCQFNGNFGTGVKGNGNVETVERHIDENFSEIKVSRGLDVYLTQSDNVSLKVQADENLHDIIMTEVENNVLRIYADENIKRSSSKKVMVSFKDISKISSSSGSDVYSTNTITTESLEISTSSGSDMELDVNTHVLECAECSNIKGRNAPSQDEHPVAFTHTQLPEHVGKAVALLLSISIGKIENSAALAQLTDSEVVTPWANGMAVYRLVGNIQPFAAWQAV